jgi:transposase-like protein
LAFYDFPAEHWMHLRTRNVIEGVSATVRLRTEKTKGSGTRGACLWEIGEDANDAVPVLIERMKQAIAQKDNFMAVLPAGAILKIDPIDNCAAKDS